MTTSTDKSGTQRTGTYDEFGRARTAQREDSTIVQINPIEVQGLRTERETTNLAQLTVAQVFTPNPVSTYTDANGNVKINQLDNKGHIIKSSDSLGLDTIFERDANDRIIREINSMGGTTTYTYDQNGNVIAVGTGATVIYSTTGNIYGNTTGVDVSKLGDIRTKSFATLSTLASGRAKALTKGDINNDGYIDIISTADNGKLNVLLGDINGAFTNKFTISTSPFTESNIINQLDLIDVNNDGKLDLIASLPIDGQAGGGGGGSAAASLNLFDPILVFLNQGTGRFSSPKILSLTAKSDGFVTGDFNNDGKLDILVRSDIDSSRINNVYPLVLYAGNGTGNFIEQQIRVPGIDSNSSFALSLQMAAADFNGDGKTELILNAYDHLSVYSYSNNGVWSEIYRNISNFSEQRGGFSVGDLDKDGKLDISTVGYKKIEVLFGQGNNNFQSKTFTHNVEYDGITKVEIKDVNGDKRPDLAIFKSSNSVETFTLQGEQLVQSESPFRIEGQLVYDAYRGMIDIDNNGVMELLLENLSNTSIGIASNYSASAVDHTTSYSVSKAKVKTYTYDSTFNQITSVTDEQGHKTFYALDSANGNVLTATQVVGLLDTTSGETDDIVTKYTYASNGRIDTITDALQHVTDYDYDVYGNVSKLISAKGTLDETVEQYQYDLAGNLVSRIDPLGRRTSYTYNSTNMLLQIIDALGGKITYGYDLMGHRTSVADQLGHVTKMTYDVRGRLATTIDTDGNISTNTYDNDGNLISVKDALGRVTKYTYDARNRVTSVISPENGVTKYTYDSNGNLTKVTDSLGRSISRYYTSDNILNNERDALGNQTIYRYDELNQLIQAATINTDGTYRNFTSYHYDDLGRSTAEFKSLSSRSIVIPLGYHNYQGAIYTDGYAERTEYDKLGNVIATFDANGNRTGYKYDALNRRIEIVDATGGVNRIVYDKAGHVISTTDALNHSTTFDYDALDRVIHVTDPLGHSTTNTYDAVGNLRSFTDSLGQATTYSYDNLNRQVSTTDALGQTKLLSYDAVGNVVKTTNEAGQSTTFTYDALNRVTKVTDALGYTQSNVYDTEGNIISKTDQLGNITTYAYDALNRVTKIVDALGGITTRSYDFDGNLAAVTNALNKSTNFAYDALGKQVSVTDALGNRSTRTFDGLGNILTSTDALGRVTKSSYDKLGRQISTTDVLGQQQLYTYDAVGNLLSTKNELGQVTTFAYDALDRSTGITDALGHTQTTAYDAIGNIRSTIDAIGNTTRYDYDALNRQVKVTDAKGGITGTTYNAVGNVTKITDSVGNSTSYSYDAIDRLITDTNQLGFSRSFAYDAVGNRVEMVDRNNRKTTYAYDTLNRQTSENWIGAGGVSLRAIGYTYDAVGNLLTVTDPDAKYTYGYDALDRVISLDNAGTSGVPTVAFNYLYDTVGRLVTVSDRINNTNAGQTDYAFDQLNRVTRITQSGTGVQSKRVDMTYNKVNQMTGLSRFSDLGGINLVAETSYTFDQSQRLTQLAHKKGANNLASYDYTYDSANKLTKIVSSVDGTVDYTYDATNQLTGADHSSQADEAYQYDANGNRTNPGYQTGTNNQLLADGQFTYEYDHEGNRTKRTETATGKVTEYVWDYHNRLTGVVFKDAAGAVLKNIDYIYDVNNQRIGKKINGVVTERYVLDRNQIALVFDGQGVQKARYLYGTQVDQVLAEESGTQVHWFLADHQGTVKDVVDNTGTVIDHITYDSFGRIVGQTNPIDLRFAYTGREWDGETGQYYYRARYYDPAVGRFISEDPIGFIGGDSNLSRYVGNSPNNFIDPNGLEAAVATATVATATTTTTVGTLLSTLLLPATLVIAPVTAVFWATPTGGGRPEDIAAANKRPKLEPPLPQPPLPRPVPQPQTEPYGPPEPKTLSPAESKYWRDYYNAQDRKLERPTPTPLKRPNPRPSPEPSFAPSPDPNCPKNEEEDDNGFVPIYKAPRIGTADRLFNSGFSYVDFGGDGYGFNYFAKDKFLADDYASRKGGYDGRVLQVNINKKIYQTKFKNYEGFHNGNPTEIELEIPASEISVLNSSPRFLSGSPHDR